MRTATSLTALFAKYTRPSIVLALMVMSSLASALMVSRPLRADDDEYVRSMRTEGHKLEQLDRRPAAADEKYTDTTVRDFEAALIQDSPDSYRIYQQLTPEKRQAVLKFYLEERNLKTVRRRIIDLRLGG